MKSWKKSTRTTLSCRICLSLWRLVILCWSRRVSSCVCCSETDDCCCRDNFSELHSPIWTKQKKYNHRLSLDWVLLVTKKMVSCQRVPTSSQDDTKVNHFFQAFTTHIIQQLGYLKPICTYCFPVVVLTSLSKCCCFSVICFSAPLNFSALSITCFSKLAI